MKVSIITATYNSLHHLPSAFESIKTQTYSDIEWIIVDGGSTDGTVEFIQQNKNSIGLWVSEKDNGIYNALNKGIKMATGDIIGFLHSDDFFADKDLIANIVEKFQTTKAEGVYGDLNYVRAENTDKVVRKWKSKPFKKSYLSFGWMPAHPTLFLKKEVYNKHGEFDESFRIAADYDFMLRILRDDTLNYQYLPKVITNMRLGGASSATKNLLFKMKEDLRAMKNNHLFFPFGTLLFKNLRKLGQFL